MANSIKLPDFEDMMQKVDKIKEIELKYLLKKIEIESAVADIIKDSRTNTEFFENGKPPSMSYLESTVAFTGRKNELIPLRKELADLQVKLNHLQLINKVQHEQVGVWRTVEASQRRSVQA